MNKQDFESGVVQKLRQVPFETRKTWSAEDLMGWWFRLEQEDSYLRLNGCTDHWQQVHSIGLHRRLFGPDAVM